MSAIVLVICSGLTDFFDYTKLLICIYLPRTLEQNVTFWGGHTHPFVILNYEASKPSFFVHVS